MSPGLFFCHQFTPALLQGPWTLTWFPLTQQTRLTLLILNQNQNYRPGMTATVEPGLQKANQSLTIHVLNQHFFHFFLISNTVKFNCLYNWCYVLAFLPEHLHDYDSLNLKLKLFNKPTESWTDAKNVTVTFLFLNRDLIISSHLPGNSNHMTHKTFNH